MKKLLFSLLLGTLVTQSESLGATAKLILMNSENEPKGEELTLRVNNKTTIKNLKDHIQSMNGHPTNTQKIWHENPFSVLRDDALVFQQFNAILDESYDFNVTCELIDEEGRYIEISPAPPSPDDDRWEEDDNETFFSSTEIVMGGVVVIIVVGRALYYYYFSDEIAPQTTSAKTKKAKGLNKK